MIATKETKTQLIDIVLPAPPPEVFDYTSLLATMLALSIVIIYLVYKARQSGLKYKVLILFLKNKVIAAEITPQQAAYDLAQILKSAHKTNHLATIEKNMSRSQKKKWHPFLMELSTFRYSAHEIKSQDILSLLNKALLWTARVLP